jgi:hypothetical protein
MISPSTLCVKNKPAKAEARVGQTEVVSTGEKMRYLLPIPGGTLTEGWQIG